MHKFKDGSSPVQRVRRTLPKGRGSRSACGVCGQGLLLREHGYVCEEGILYFAGSRERVVVPFDDALVNQTLQLAEEVRPTVVADVMPPSAR